MKWRTFLITLLLLPALVGAQNEIAREINGLRDAGVSFETVTPVQFATDDLDSRSVQGVTNGTLVSVDQQAIRGLQEEPEYAMSMDIPQDRGSIRLDLVRYDLLSGDFQLFASHDPENPVGYTPGLYYRGVVSGNDQSIATVSIFNDEIMAFVSTEDGNIVMGRIKGNRENLHIVYNDRDLTSAPDWECATPDLDVIEDLEHIRDNTQRDPGDCIRVYIEIDDDIVTNKGGEVGATNYITGLFNEVIALYANESIDMSISEILAWTTPAPYSGSSSSAMLNSFQANTGSFNGDLAHLVSYQASGGIAAGFNGICASNPDNSKCFSSIDASYAQVPTYSWSVMVCTHEMGHLIGSRHTHACVWNGNNTAIDGCAGSTEGSCSLPGNPSGGGTIMSYCHLQSVGINFNNGFGPQPGDVIRTTVNQSGNCLTPCDGPPPPPQYCAASGSSQQYEYIQAVALGSINNNSGNNSGYGDFTGQSTNLNVGSSYTVACTPGFTGSAYTEYWSVWIDYNGDLDFNDAGEQVGTGSGSSVVNINFTVPGSLADVTTRMRVAMQYSSTPPVCGSFQYGEVEDYTVVIGGGSEPTCNDGVQNGDEEGVDCGGSCPPCPTCNDGIQNGDEEGVDCGGSTCPPCPTCNDGIQNGDETGVDCGGSCPPCPTCNDGIQNGDEEGVDCGGSCPNDCPAGGVLFAHYFESGWDGWADGGSDCYRYSGSRSWEGNYSIRIRDNSGTASSMTSSVYDVSGASSIEIEFYFYAWSMEVGEDFWVMFYDGSTWNVVAAYARGTSFNNNTFYVATVTLTSANYNFPSNAQFRFRCDASGNQDHIYIDAVTVTTTGSGALVEPGQTIVALGEVPDPVIEETSLAIQPTGDIQVYPNPTNDVLNVVASSRFEQVRIIDMQGVELYAAKSDNLTSSINVSKLGPGLYIVMILQEGRWIPTKFVKN